jgi:hypothetical protein
VGGVPESDVLPAELTTGEATATGSDGAASGTTTTGSTLFRAEMTGKVTVARQHRERPSSA